MVPIGWSTLLASFSKEEFLDCNLLQDAIKILVKSLLEEGFREIDITLIIKAPIFWFGLLGQPQ
jgi:hypothetical protein